ncbi:small ribosomal subunit protein mS40 [Microcaecilia unicolor]|uniref:Small ribosomal subunit protein mS40 n=1 Tax=Microcaecilia unicolor TaxID=1415580 RepID=A0A6P7XS22_9AMPH|nr:28S ribosomal protein S18b, mitochondrial [Microcaecilia unicolor]
MAASLCGIIWRRMLGTGIRGSQPQVLLAGLAPRLRFKFLSSTAETADMTDTSATAALNTMSRYKEKPWDYLTSEEYQERYGEQPVWANYRRNHKGGIPPQKTRKMCIRGGKVCGNPCPICRDQKLGLDYRNVKLLEQFISPYSGNILDATRTGVCRKQQKNLTKVIAQAREHGLLPFHIPFMEFQPAEDYVNTHAAVNKTPPAPALQNQTAWYPWYDWQQPADKEVARLRKMYKPFLKVEVAALS